MNPAHLHLLLNHIPILVTLVGSGLLAYAMARRSDELVRTSVGLLVLAALTTVPVFRSGEPAEEVVEHRPEVSEALIDRHEEAAQIAAVGIGVLGLLGFVGLLVFHRRARVPDWFSRGVLVLSLVAAALLARTANLGGQIRHAEIRATFGVDAADARRQGRLDDD